jgi:hypothetical protein
MSSASSVNDALAGYLAGRVSAERVVTVVAAEYYGAGVSGLGTREALKTLMETIERAHPGIIALTATADRPGFAIQLAERPFPKRHEAEFRQAVQAALVRGFDFPRPEALAPRPGLFSRLIRAIRRVFSA